MSQSNSALGTAGNLLRHKLSGETYKPSMFRVGMTLALDPTPFILAGPGLKLQQPEGTGSGQVSVSAVGQVVSGKTQLVRLYLPDKHSLVQLHLDPDRRARRVPAVRHHRRDHPHGPRRMGRMARSQRGHDRLARVPDQGRQNLRTRLGAGWQPCVAAHADRDD